MKSIVLGVILLITCISTASIKNKLPTNPCPELLSYEKDNQRGGWYGKLLVPKKAGLTKYEIEVNMIINKNIDKSEIIQLFPMSTNEDVYRARVLKLGIKFPVQDMLPTMIELKVNGVRICGSDPDMVRHDTTQVSMWSKTAVRTNMPTVRKIGEKMTVEP